MQQRPVAHWLRRRADRPGSQGVRNSTLDGRSEHSTHTRDGPLPAGWCPHSTDAHRRLNLYLRLLCHFQRVIDLDAQVSHGAFQFRVAEQ